MVQTESLGPVQSDNVTVLSVRSLRTTPAGKSVVIVSREGMKRNRHPGFKTTSDPVWETGGGDRTGYKQYQSQSPAWTAAEPAGGKTDFACSVTVALEDYPDLSNRSRKQVQEKTLTFQPGELVKAAVFDRAQGTLVARLRDAKLGSAGSGSIQCGICCELEDGRASNPLVLKQIQQLISEHSPAYTAGNYGDPDRLYVNGGLSLSTETSATFELPDDWGDLREREGTGEEPTPGAADDDGVDWDASERSTYGPKQGIPANDARSGKALVFRTSALQHPFKNELTKLI
ncbi:hypothetical protein ACIRU8_28765 [Streptomyces sp. NPDC101175]|uniref:hypothetical protein n=1 Tax=Streptomyces sp. NPDC101175 TaxID=3366123 RepID=UPI003838B784